MKKLHKEDLKFIWVLVMIGIFLMLITSCASQNAIRGTNHWHPGVATQGHYYSHHNGHFWFSGRLAH